MKLASQLKAHKSQSRDLTLAERARLSCRLAKHLEKAGEYEAASEALNEFWPERDGQPEVDPLDEPTKAAVLLRVGALVGWLGSADQTQGSQETAKDLITRAIEIFEKLDQSDEAAEARSDLAVCYWREGAFDEARVILRQALEEIGSRNSEIRAIALIRSAVVEKTAVRYSEALNIFNEAKPLVDATNDHAVKGTFHNGLATLLNCRGLAEKRQDYIDQSLIEFAAASFHFELGGHDRFLARVENNLGYLFFTIGRYEDAHSHLDRARRLFLKFKDIGTAAQVDETRARILLAEGRVLEAERMVRSAVRTLERGGEEAVLAEALTTQGIALARLGHHSRAKGLLEQAMEVGGSAGDLEGAGRAKLSIIEELGEKIPAKELVSIYRSAIELLKSSQDPSTGKRLITCAGKLLDTLARLEGEDQESQEQTWEGFSFKQHVRDGERAVIERALRDSGGSVTKAARLLGFKHHQSLISLINSRHKELLTTRSAVRKRRRHLFSHPRQIEKKTLEGRAKPATSEISILHIEDNKVVARLVQDTLGAERMHVDSCISGTTALEILKSDAPYDAIIVDNDLPGLSGLELVLRMRSMAHRRNTPIIMLSGDDCEKEAWRAGVNDFLRKPEAVEQLSSTIARVLQELKAQGD